MGFPALVLYFLTLSFRLWSGFDSASFMRFSMAFILKKLSFGCDLYLDVLSVTNRFRRMLAALRVPWILNLLNSLFMMTACSLDTLNRIDLLIFGRKLIEFRWMLWRLFYRLVPRLSPMRFGRLVLLRIYQVIMLLNYFL